MRLRRPMRRLMRRGKIENQSERILWYMALVRFSMWSLGIHRLCAHSDFLFSPSAHQLDGSIK
jgi:hypothetical protein